jgi:phage/plasmid-like protein (TIGR03299 family)
MAHDMTETDSAMYFGVGAWHGLGVVVDEATNPREALRVAGLDWNVVPSVALDYYYCDSDGETRRGTTTRKVANVRQDTGDVLGWVSPEYDVVQNSELAELAYGLAGDNTVVESFGSIGGGARIYCLIRCDSFDAASTKDVVDEFMLLCNGHDGSLTLSGMPTSIRVVCNNTLRMALAGAQSSMFRFTHSGDMAAKLMEARKALDFFRETGKTFRQSVGELVHKEWTKQDIQKFWLHIYEELENKNINVNPYTETEEKDYTKACATIAGWSERFDGEMSELNVNRANAWMAANAVTDWIQHRDAKRGRKMSADSRTNKNLFGKAASDSVMVMREALAY